MAKKLQKNTSMAKAKSLKTNVTRKFAVGGTGDPIKVTPTIEKPVQPFPEFYNADKETFDAADNSARSYMTDWFSKRAQAFPERHGEAANAMGSYLQNSAQSAYVPEGTQFKGVSGTADAYGFANEPDYRLSLDQTTATKALSDNPFSSPESGGKIKGSNAPLNYNTAYYIGEGGKMPTTQLEEQLHLASNYGEHMSDNHAGSFKRAGDYINAGAIGEMGYQGMAGNEDYYGDTQEFYPRLMSARRTFGLDPAKEYTQQEMSNFLDKGYNDILNNNFTEPGQKEHLIEFYKQLGYPTPSAEFTKGASEEAIKKQKEAAAEKFRKSNDEFAMQNSTADDYGLPKMSRYGGYKTYAMGGAVNPCPKGQVPDGKGGCTTVMTTPPREDSSLYYRYMNDVRQYGEEFAQRLLKSNRLPCHGGECWDDETPLKIPPKPGDPKQHYTIKHSTNPGQSHLWKYTDDGNSGYNQELIGSVFNRDFLNDEQQSQYDSAQGGTWVVDYDPNVQKVYSDQHDVNQTIENELGIKQKAQSNLNKAQQEIEAEKARQEQWQKEQREKQNKKISSQQFSKGGMNKNMLNANSTTGPRSKQSWQDPGVNEFSGNTNGVQAPYYFNYGGLKNQVARKFRAAGFETDPPPVAPVEPPVDEDYKMRYDYANAMAALEAQNATYNKRLADEQARVKKVRANVIPAARALDYADSNLSEESINAFYRSTGANNRAELNAAIKAYPQELKNVLPKGGNYNIASWDESANDWKSGSGPDRELYCTPYGCFTYQKAGATDVPIVSGNYGFTGGVDRGELPFEKVSDKEAQAGDMAIIYGSAPASYTEGGRYVIRPHHTTVLSDHNPIVRDDRGNILGINMYNASNGMRLNYQEEYYPKEDHFGFYRYVGQLPKLEKEGAGFDKRRQSIEDEYNARHAAWLAQQPIPETMAMKEASPLPMQGMPQITSQLQNSNFPSFEQPNKKVRRTKIKI